jgi:RNA polymerase-interacting CarD/CdnL/TRCF family regulator
MPLTGPSWILATWAQVVEVVLELSGIVSARGLSAGEKRMPARARRMLRQES